MPYAQYSSTSTAVFGPILRGFGHVAAVSKAFSCLSDATKRAAYDRYGEEQPGGRSGRGAPFAGGQGFDDFDPNEIFNMFFNGFGGNRCAATGCKRPLLRYNVCSL